MHNIIKALNYQTRRDNFLIYSILAGLYMIVISLIDYFNYNFDKLNGGTVVAVTGTQMCISMSVIFTVLLLGTRICGWDYADKTMNYEILAGHSRKHVYWSRVIVCIIWCTCVSLAIVILPVIVFTIINGWGDNMSFGGAAVRYLLLIFPMFRIICEFALITFLTGSCYKGMVLGFILSETGMMIYVLAEELADFKCRYLLSMSNIDALFAFNAKFGYVNGMDIEVYETAVKPSLAVGTIIISLAVGAGCLLIGWLVFKKRDVN